MMTWEQLHELYETLKEPWDTELSPSFNVAPYQWSPVVWSPAEGYRQAKLMRWAVIPPFEPKPTTKYSTINARTETITSSPVFAPLFKSGRRCLVPASGFYEWIDTDGDKSPYFIHPKQAPCFTFAGLWCRWSPPEGADPKLKAIDTFTIVTTESNAFMAPLHNRMPVPLAREEWDTWLDPEAETADLLALLATRDWPDATMHPVSTFVNKVKNNSPECIAHL